MRKIFYFLLVFPFVTYGQSVNNDLIISNGIRFESNLSWNDILNKAKKEGKPIFIDCYATWCGPCKYMDKNVFPLKDVGGYFNAHFINVHVQMDQTTGDSPVIRNWYKDASEMKSKYEIGSYPTYLFLSSDGYLIHRFSGASQDGISFLKRTAEALDTTKQYHYLLANWEQHKDDSAFLNHALAAAITANDITSARQIAIYYVKSLNGFFTTSNIDLLYSAITSENDAAFQAFLEHAATINQLVGRKDYVENKLGDIIFKEEIVPILLKIDLIDWQGISGKVLDKYIGLDTCLLAHVLEKELKKFISHDINNSIDKERLMQQGDWGQIEQRLIKKYVGYESDCWITLLSKEISYYQGKKLWEESSRVALSLIDQYGDSLGNLTVNNICWYVIFQHSGNKDILNAALRHMESVVKNTPSSCYFLDTYANLLYKTGHKAEAIDCENKVAEIVANKHLSYEKVWRDNLAKMKEGQPTWETNL